MSLSVDPRIGSELLGYRIEALIGQGGMSVVYLAEDLRLRRRVALKLLAPALAEDEAFRERFLEESQLAASLDHPNVVPIYEAGEAGDELYIAMRYVEGQDLKQLLSEGPLAADRGIALCAQVADALDFAHERGLVHRDVKPSNVLLDPKEHVYLADFGLTRRIGEARTAEPGLFGMMRRRSTRISNSRRRASPALRRCSRRRSPRIRPNATRRVPSSSMPCVTPSGSRSLTAACGRSESPWSGWR